ncbi:magnesium/cobalt transporter CorA [Fulvivirga lutimaris]|uniref:magnesium/cobalt transporter CorA n=1 Tax=Fulvivirga lutimaris TaxID=1819566 RepID=UPI0012BBFFAF|nr:magnesium/cobalt transporter CorA [Fulvivirga lutimaris]MTI39400.1 magnesium/cobalt transporter CorA [Fulvivirga lutimaris]
MQFNLPDLTNLPKLVFPKIGTATKTAGLPPGQLVHLGEKITDKSTVDLIHYHEQEYDETIYNNPEEALNKITEDKVNWINIDGLHNVDFIEKVGEHFEINPLVLEDVLNPDQRPKIEDYDQYIFFTLKTLNALKGENIIYEQMSFVLGKNFLISFQEREGDLFEGLRNRLKNDPKSKARKRGADYLFYRLIDTIVDSYYLILENLGERIEALEDEVFLDPSQKTLKKIQGLKKELIFLRKSVYPIREAISKVYKGEFPFIKKETERYFSDVYDHCIHVIETLETYRDLTASLMDMYMTSVSNKMNEVMKVLTVIATIFIPLTFIAGIYGMNFDNMPELHWEYGYFYVWGLMITMFAGMLYYFKKKNWF